MSITVEEIKAMFTHPPLNSELLKKIKALELAAYNQALLIIESCPDNPERDLAIRALQQSVAYARQSIHLSTE